MLSAIYIYTVAYYSDNIKYLYILTVNEILIKLCIVKTFVSDELS